MTYIKNHKGVIALWLVAALLFSIPLSTYITTSRISEAAVQRDDGDNYNCDSKRFIRYLGMGSTPVLTRMEVTARMCWKEFDAREPGKVLKGKSNMTVRFYNTGWGDTGGWRFEHVSYFTRLVGTHIFKDRIGVDSWVKQCLVVLGQFACGPSANFVPVVEFLSPYVTEPHMNNGIHKNWDFKVYCGSIGGGECGGYDDNLYVRDHI